MGTKEFGSKPQIIIAVLTIAALVLTAMMMFSRNRIDPYIRIDTGAQTDLIFYLDWSLITESGETTEVTSPRVEWLQSGTQHLLFTASALTASSGQIEILLVHPEFIPLRRQWTIKDSKKQLVITPKRWQARLANRGGVTLQEVEYHLQLVRDNWLIDGAAKSSVTQQHRSAHLLNALLAAAPCGRENNTHRCDTRSIATRDKAKQYLKEINEELQHTARHSGPELPQNAPAPEKVVPED